MRTQQIRSFLPIGLVALALIILSSPAVARDRDGDGFEDKVDRVVVDCDDRDASIYPGAPEACDGKDNQCPNDAGYGVTDEGCCTGVDSDQDGYYSANNCGTQVDCDDNDGNTYPGADEYCDDNKDNQCPGDPGYETIDEGCEAPQQACDDLDNDTYYAQSDCGTPVDCSDNNNAVYPGASELCTDGVDNDCDGQINENCVADAADPLADSDKDGFPNGVEWSGFELQSELEDFNGIFFSIPGSDDCASGVAMKCMDPAKPDFFPIIYLEPATNLNPNINIEEYFAFLTEETNGLGYQVWPLRVKAGSTLTTRVLAADFANVSYQSGPLIIEDQTPPADPPEKLGQSQWGSIHLANKGLAWFYSQRVKDVIDAACAASELPCQAATGEQYNDGTLQDRYFKWLIPHEICHVMYCVDTEDKHVTGDYLMKSAIIYTENKTKGDIKVTFHIPAVITDQTKSEVGFFPAP